MCSWRHGTQKQYSIYIKKWSNYCREREINNVQAALSDILDFSSLVDSGLSYSAINSARSALSAIGLVQDGFSVGSHPPVIRLLKGIYNMKPPQSRYSKTWDASLVLAYLKTLKSINVKISYAHSSSAGLKMPLITFTVYRKYEKGTITICSEIEWSPEKI